MFQISTENSYNVKKNKQEKLLPDLLKLNQELIQLSSFLLTLFKLLIENSNQIVWIKPKKNHQSKPKNNVKIIMKKQ